MVETVVLQTTHTREPKIIETILFMQHHLDHQIQIMTNKPFTTEGHTGQVIGFIALIHRNIPTMSLMFQTLLLENQKHHQIPVEEFMRTICCHPLR